MRTMESGYVKEPFLDAQGMCRWATFSAARQRRPLVSAFGEWVFYLALTF